MCICAGILWNLSSKDNLKEKLARETLPELTDKILIPLSGNSDTDGIHLSPSEADIFYNTTGCLRCTSFNCVLLLVAICFFIIIYIFWFSCACFFSHDHICIWRTCFSRTLQLRYHLTATETFYHTLHFLLLFAKACITPAPSALILLCFVHPVWV